MELITTVGLTVSIVVVTISSVLTLMIRELAWPPAVVKHFRRARQDEIREIVAELLAQDQARVHAERSARATAIRESGRYSDPDVRSEQLIAGALVTDGDGSGRPFSAEVPFFVDFMSASTDPRFCEECSLILASYLQNHRADVTGFDAIVGIKLGSPLIAARLAARLDLPLLLFRGRNRFKRDAPERDPADLFDGDAVHLKQRLLIVDDSMTGGRMVLDCADAIRKVGGTVTAALVAFEVIGRNGRAALEKNNIPFYAVTSVDAQKVAEIRSAGHNRNRFRTSRV